MKKRKNVQIQIISKGALLIALISCSHSGVPVEFYYPNGELKAQFKVHEVSEEKNENPLGYLLYQRDSLIVGEFTLYYEDGSIQTRSYYKDGLLNGLSAKYHPNGQIAEILNYSSGRLKTIIEMNDSSGRVLNWGTLSDGNGEVNFYFENGSIKEIGNYEDGVKQGIWKEYDKNGNISSEIIYDSGIRKSQIVYDEDGSVIKEVQF